MFFLVKCSWFSKDAVKCLFLLFLLKKHCSIKPATVIAPISHRQPAMAQAFLKWGGGGGGGGEGKSNDLISFAYNPYLACPHVTFSTYMGFRPTVLASSSCITINFFAVVMTFLKL